MLYAIVFAYKERLRYIIAVKQSCSTLSEQKNTRTQNHTAQSSIKLHGLVRLHAHALTVKSVCLCVCVLCAYSCLACAKCISIYMWSKLANGPDREQCRFTATAHATSSSTHLGAGICGTIDFPVHFLQASVFVCSYRTHSLFLCEAFMLHTHKLTRLRRRVVLKFN